MDSLRLNKDFVELLSALSSATARFVIVGGYAVGYHSEPRYTKDLDVLVEPTRVNAARVLEALRAFGAPLQGVGIEIFSDSRLVYQIGREPNRVDILMGIDGVSFATVWRNRVSVEIGGVPVSVISARDLIRAKRAAGRPQDVLDVLRLQQAPRKSRRRGRGRGRGGAADGAGWTQIKD